MRRRRVARGKPVSGVRITGMEHKRPGRPSKGPRHRIPLRIPVALHQAIADKAGHLGVTVNDYLIELAERDLNVQAQAQQRLPMAG